MAAPEGNSSIELIDPNEVVSRLPKDYNGTPDYEKMFTFVSLKARRRPRSVLVNEGKRVSVEDGLDEININMLGFDQETGEFTTRWGDTIDTTRTIYEGFGVTQIQVKTNSSYIPQVNIEFTDIRGSAFFNLGEKSPYAVLFDFPPPIFELTLKGYYGRTLTYQLHLVKHATRFNAETGNYVTNAEFIARTFAPLTDVPFKYIDIFPLINRQTEPSVDPEIQANQTGGKDTLDTSRLNTSNFVRPRNTHELILKLQNLYDDIAELRETSQEANDLRDAQKALNEGNAVISQINNFANLMSAEKYQNVSVIFVKQFINEDSDSEIFQEIINVNQYDEIIQADSDDAINEDKNEKLYLSICLGRQNEETGRIETIGLTEDIDKELEALRVVLLNNAENFIADIKESDIGAPEGVSDYNLLENTPSVDANDSIEYRAIDITSFYLKIKKYINERSKEISDNQKLLVGKANQAAITNLGMYPTIYNIFEIICDDVDTFFNTLRDTAKSAEEHHNQYQNLILDQIQQTKISAFPLYVSASTTNCVRRESRAIPVDLSNKVANAVGRPFPEIDLINEFINQFILLEKEELIKELKEQEDASGNNKWIPVTPADSIYFTDNKESPYTRIEYQYQGSGVNEKINKIYNKIIERFYVASQYTYGKQFYEQNPYIVQRLSENQLKNSDLIKFAAGAEAVNLAQSLTDTNTIIQLERIANSFKSKSSISTLFAEWEKTTPTYSSVVNGLNSPTNKYVTIGNTRGLTTDGEYNVSSVSTDIVDLYKDRKEGDDESNPKFIGVKILRGDKFPQTRNNNNNDSTNPVDKYMNNDTGIIQGVYDFIRGGDDTPTEFTKENVLYIKDVESGNDFTTKYIDGFAGSPPIVSIISPAAGAINTARYGFENSFTNVWGSVLAKDNFGVEFLDVLSGSTYSETAKGFFIVSSFLKSRSYYHRQSTGRFQVNDSFIFPAVNEVPYFSILYMSGIVNLIENPTVLDEVRDMIDTFTRDFSTDAGGLELDILLVENILASRDKDEFRGYFNGFMRKEYNDVKRNLEGMIRRVETTEFDPDFLDSVLSFTKKLFVNSDLTNEEQLKANAYSEELVNVEVNTITRPLNEKIGLVVTNQYAFSVDPDDETETTDFEALSITNGDTNKLEANEIYFAEFFKVLADNIKKQKEAVQDIENSAVDSIQDNDVKSQLYYSFKSISDKWIAGLSSSVRGFPLNTGSDERLIDKFMFVDRAMNPIGDDCIINVEPLLDLAQDYDVNVFTVISQLLSHNGFEFFPLQNFMSYENARWEESFGVFESVNQDAVPAFVCMYIGGTSSVLNSVSSDFEDDGIQDLVAEGLPDFKNNDCEANEVEGSTRIKGTNVEQPYSQVKAFRVRYAEQNQSFFNTIELEGRDFPETNDSLAILSKIAGDESKTSPVPKGQNLFSIYESRAYSAKVTMLGNVMVQPTQYFQLENIPMYSGAYVILDVEHTFTPNHAVTIFQGTRLLKFPNPIVTEFATSIGIQSGTAEDLSANINIDDVKSSPLYEEARRTGFFDAVLTPINQGTWDDVTDNRIQMLHPQIKQRATDFINALFDEGITARISDGTRTIYQQDRLYDQGRTTSGDIVTNAKGGESYHNFGLAFDVVEIQDGRAIFENPNWNKIGEIGKSFGFEWGGDFTSIVDLPHFQESFGLSTSELNALIDDGRNVGTFPIIPKENILAG